MDALPTWPPGTAAVLCVAGPHAIPVSTAIRAGDRRALLALGGKRETLRRLRDVDPAVALCVLAKGLAFTAKGRASVIREGVQAAPALAVVEIAVDEIVDHLADGRTSMDGSAPWHWVDEKAAASDPQIRAELEALS